jgi:hypothetical protein
MARVHGAEMKRRSSHELSGLGRYYNPGSWTHYIDADAVDSLTLEDLESEARFPYELNCVRVEDPGGDTLLSEWICIDRRPPR